MENKSTKLLNLLVVGSLLAIIVFAFRTTDHKRFKNWLGLAPVTACFPGIMQPTEWQVLGEEYHAVVWTDTLGWLELIPGENPPDISPYTGDIELIAQEVETGDVHIVYASNDPVNTFYFGGDDVMYQMKFVHCNSITYILVDESPRGE